MMAFLLDLANIVGGFLLSVQLLRQIPRIGDDLARTARTLSPFAWIVGVVALVAGGYYLLVHLTSGPHVFHFELIGIAVGVALLWDRLTGRRPVSAGGGQPLDGTTAQGSALLLAVLGLIAIIVGLQGLFTPN
jgi:hypothetical protein